MVQRLLESSPSQPFSSEESHGPAQGGRKTEPACGPGPDDLGHSPPHTQVHGQAPGHLCRQGSIWTPAWLSRTWGQCPKSWSEQSGPMTQLGSWASGGTPSTSAKRLESSLCHAVLGLVPPPTRGWGFCMIYVVRGPEPFPLLGLSLLSLIFPLVCSCPRPRGCDVCPLGTCLAEESIPASWVGLQTSAGSFRR